MRSIKRKKLKKHLETIGKWAKRVANSAILTAFLASVVFPLSISAKTGKQIHPDVYVGQKLAKNSQEKGPVLDNDAQVSKNKESNDSIGSSMVVKIKKLAKDSKKNQNQHPILTQGRDIKPKPKPSLKENIPDKVVSAVITAYTSTPDQTDDSPFIAATGKRVYDGMIAANWLPFGTKVKIPSLYGNKIFTVDDRMNARYGYGRMDIWMDSEKSEAFKFGIKRVDVEVYYETVQLSMGK